MEIDETHPADERHPSHPDNHHYREHHPHARNIHHMLIVFLVVVAILLFLFGTLTNAPFGNVVLGFAPSIIFGMIAITLLHHDHFDIRYLALSLIAVLIIFGVLIGSLAPSIDLVSILGMNLILGVVALVVVAQSFHRDPNDQTVELVAEQQEFPEIIRSVEDRCKALNFSIGRVYSVHNGATAGMRTKIKIPSDWYNELSSALESPEENQNIILGALEKIKRRLELLDESEKKVFSDAEVSRLKKLERQNDGSSRVIEVLSINDGDPVEQFVVSALEHVTLAIERLTGDQR